MRRLLHASCVVALAACGASSPPLTSAAASSGAPTSAAAPSSALPPAAPASGFLSQIPTLPGVRDVCDDPHEPVIRQLLPDLPPCARSTHLGYVVARTTAGTVLVVRGRLDASEASPRSQSVSAIVVDGQAVDTVPTGTPSSRADRRALFLAAALVTADDPRVAIEGPEAIEIVPAAARPYVEGAFRADEDAHHASLIVVTEQNEEAGYVRIARRVASIDDEGRVSLTDEAHDEPIATASDDGGCSPRLEALAATAQLETVSTPRPLCGDAQEAAIRQRMPALPPCDQISGALHLVARTPGDARREGHPPVGEMIVVVWGRGREHQSVFSDGCVSRAMGRSFIQTEEGTRAMLEAAILSIRGTTDYATSVEAIPASVPRAVRARLSREHLGLVSGRLIAVTWPHDGDRGMYRYEARHDELQVFSVFVYELLPRGGERLVRDPYEEIELFALDGL